MKHIKCFSTFKFVRQ